VSRTNDGLPADMKIVSLNDASVMTSTMLDVLLGNALAGMLLVFIVLLAFFEFRFTIWVVLGIPTSIMMVFTLLPVLGISVNLLSMSALILMLGILVDDAVVIAESIFRQREYGHPPNEAALLGVEKVMLPVFASALTTVVALAPMAFLGGIQGKIMWVIPVMAMLVLLMSLLECKFILPGHIAHSFRDGARTRLSRPWFEWVENAYEAIMMRIVPARYLFVLGVLILFALLAAFAARNAIVVINPKSDTDIVFVKAEAPIGTSFTEMERRLLALEKTIREVVPAEALDQIVVTAGHHDHNNRRATEGRDVAWGMVSIFLKQANDRHVNSLDLQQQLREALSNERDYRRLTVITQMIGADMGWPLEAVVIGNGSDRFAVADMIHEFVATIPGVTDHWTSYVGGKPVVSLELDYVALASHDLSVSDVSDAVQIAFNGKIVDQYETIEENINYRMLLDGIEVTDPASLYSLTVSNSRGDVIPLRQLVEFRQQPGEGTISHFLGDRATTVFADIDRSVIGLKEINQKVAGFLAQSDIGQRFPYVSVYFDGELVTTEEQTGSAAKAFLVALVCIAFILILLFHSALQPLMVIALIPFGVIGVFCVFVLHGLEMSMAGLVGIAGLMGVIVNDALVMLDRFNTERRLHSAEANTLLHDRQIVECASVRLRPIVITTVTTCAGLFPAAYGFSGSYDLITPMIMVMLWGVMIASLTTLFVLPCFYAMERDLLKLLNRKLVLQRLDDVIMYN
ncbi:MAG: efflux RND transporter permease subunit, partial [Pseudomonadales bacterium]